MFKWLRNRRRKKLLAGPFPEGWEAILRRNVWQYATLPMAEQEKFRGDLRVFVAEKYWEGCGGLTMTDEVKVTVAAYAVLLVLGLSIDEYERVLTILIYPDDFAAPDTVVTDEGFHREEVVDLGGQAWHGGPVILSWGDLIDSIRDPGSGRNVAIHEFAHQLDMRNPGADGMPPLESQRQIDRWRRVVRAEYDALVRLAEQGRESLLDEYGATDLTEFFAVATESFFEEPGELSRRHPALYVVLRDYYRQDPAGR